MKRLAVIALSAVSACAGRPQMFISDVWIESYDLVIERCPMQNSSFDCTKERQPLPAAWSSGTTPYVADTASYRNVGLASEALAPCAARYRLEGVLQVTLVIAPTGHITTVMAEGTQDLTSCATSSLASIPFATSPTGSRLTFAWHVPVAKEPS